MLRLALLVGCGRDSRHNFPMSSGRSNMLRPDNVFLAVNPVDMRRGIDTLTQYIQDELKSTWHEGGRLRLCQQSPFAY